MILIFQLTTIYQAAESNLIQNNKANIKDLFCMYHLLTKFFGNALVFTFRMEMPDNINNVKL